MRSGSLLNLAGIIARPIRQTLHPAATFVDLCTLNKMRIIPIKQEMMAKILKSHPYCAPSVIPARACPQLETAELIASGTLMISGYDRPMDAYSLPKNIV